MAFVTQACRLPKQVRTLPKKVRTFTSGHASQYTGFARLLVRNLRHVEQILQEILKFKMYAEAFGEKCTIEINMHIENDTNLCLCVEWRLFQFLLSFYEICMKISKL